MRERSLARPAVVSAMLLSSGLLMVAASAERWWPACKPGAFDTDACLTLQDHLYDFVTVGEPWRSIGSAAQLAGASMLLLAAAMAVLPSMLSRKPRLLTWIPGILIAAGFALTGAQALLSGIADEVVEWSNPLVSTLTLVAYLWPVWGAAWWLIAVGGANWRPRNGWQYGLAVTLILSTPVPLYIFVAPAVVNYVSHDTAPWTEAVGGWLLVVAAALVWPADRWPERRRSRRDGDDSAARLRERQGGGSGDVKEIFSNV